MRLRYIALGDNICGVSGVDANVSKWMVKSFFHLDQDGGIQGLAGSVGVCPVHAVPCIRRRLAKSDWKPKPPPCSRSQLPR